MIDAPFLELAYFVGERRAETAISALVNSTPDARLGPPRRLGEKVFIVPGLIGLAGDEEVERYGGTIVLRTEGEAFCGPARTKRRRLRDAGRTICARFIAYAELFDPLYGAILVEYSLEEPEELRREPGSLAFHDFYISNRLLGSRDAQFVRAIVGDGALIREAASGFYVAMSEEFSEGTSALSVSEVQRRSVKMGRFIGHCASRCELD